MIIYKINAPETNVVVAIVCQMELLRVSLNYPTVNKYSQLRYRCGYTKNTTQRFQINVFNPKFQQSSNL